MKTRLVFLVIFWSLFGVAHGQNEFEKKVYVSASGDTLNYRLLRPEVEQEGKQYPLVLFLHGAGERGSDNEKQLFHGSQMWLNPVNRKNYPAYVLFPQCPESGYWAYVERPSVFQPKKMLANFPISPIFVVLKELLDSYLALPQVDKSRIYIIGLSMGAMGVYDLTVRYPEIFAAAIPICGIVNPKRLKAAKDVKFRIFHGSEDNIVPPSGSRRAYKALKKAGAEVQYIEFPGVGHTSWHQAFNVPDFMKWLFFQKKE